MKSRFFIMRIAWLGSDSALITQWSPNLKYTQHQMTQKSFAAVKTTLVCGILALCHLSYCSEQPVMALMCFPFAIPPPVAWSLSSLGEDVAKRLLTLPEGSGWEGSFQSSGLYRVRKRSHKSPSATTAWSPSGQVILCLSKRQDRHKSSEVTLHRSPGLHSMIIQAERQTLPVGVSVF